MSRYDDLFVSCSSPSVMLTCPALRARLRVRARIRVRVRVRARARTSHMPGVVDEEGAFLDVLARVEAALAVARVLAVLDDGDLEPLRPAHLARVRVRVRVGARVGVGVRVRVSANPHPHPHPTLTLTEVGSAILSRRNWHSSGTSFHSSWLVYCTVRGHPSGGLVRVRVRVRVS